MGDVILRAFAALGVLAVLLVAAWVALSRRTARREQKTAGQPLPPFPDLSDEQWDRFLDDLQKRPPRGGDVHDVFPEEDR